MERPEIHIEPKLIGDLLDIIYNATLIINSDHRIIFANSRTSDMFRADDSQLKGMPFNDLFCKEDSAILANNIITLTRKNNEFEGEALLRRVDGSTFLGLISGTYFSWDSHQEGMAFTINDISTMKTLEISLKKTERVAFLGRLVNDISHQIRNPVMVIGGFARRLLKENKEDSPTQTILDESVRLETLLDTLNHFISLPAPKPERTTVLALFESIEKKLPRQIEKLGCKWESSIDKAIMEEALLVDQPLLLEALEAIIKNSGESYLAENISNDKKIVSLSLKKSSTPDCPILIEIVDKGVGIKPESLDKVFAHFYTEKTRHIGMGLTLARRIIEEQMGTIILESEEGEGAKVSICLAKERRREIRTKLLNDR